MRYYAANERCKIALVYSLEGAEFAIWPQEGPAARACSAVIRWSSKSSKLRPGERIRRIVNTNKVEHHDLSIFLCDIVSQIRSMTSYIWMSCPFAELG